MTGRWPIVLIFAGVVLSPGGIVARAADLTREQALAAIADARDVDGRRRGALALGERGLMADTRQLSQALRDDDPLVRAFAENAMWQVWSRSGDDAVDQLFASASSR